MSWALGFCRTPLACFDGRVRSLAVILTQRRLTWWRVVPRGPFLPRMRESGLWKIRGEDQPEALPGSTAIRQEWGEQPTERHLAKAAGVLRNYQRRRR